MSRYAKGKYALGECGRSGKILPLKDMVEDGYIKGMLVSKEYYEAPDPSLHYQPKTDAVALERTAPRADGSDIEIAIPTLNTNTFEKNSAFSISVSLAPASTIILSYDEADFLITEDGDYITDENGNLIIME